MAGYAAPQIVKKWAFDKLVALQSLGRSMSQILLHGLAPNGSTPRLIARLMLAHQLLNTSLAPSFGLLPNGASVLATDGIFPDVPAIGINMVLFWGAVVLALGYRVRLTAFVLGVIAVFLLSAQTASAGADASFWPPFNAFAITVLSGFVMSKGSGDYTVGWIVATLKYRRWLHEAS